MFRRLGISWLARQWALSRGLRSDNEVVRFVGLLLVGRMAFVRRRARRRGVVGGEPVWQVLAGALFLGDLVRRLTMKEVEVLTVEKLKAGNGLQIMSLEPSSRRGRRSS